MQKRYSFFIFLFFLYLPLLHAQYFEVGAWLGTSNYLGDLAPPQQYFLETRFAGGAGMQYNFHPHIAARLSSSWGQLNGNDANSSEASGRRQRNLSFTSPLWELSLCGVFNILPYKPRMKKRIITPYVFMGIAFFHFSPKTLYKTNWIDLHPLNTEGQGLKGYPEPYKLSQWAIPFGGGIRFSLSKRVNFMFELGLRKTFTDYIDDVSGSYVDVDLLRQENGARSAILSNRTLDEFGVQVPLTGEQRGSPAKDWYVLTGVRITYNFIKYYAFKK